MEELDEIVLKNCEVLSKIKPFRIGLTEAEMTKTIIAFTETMLAIKKSGLNEEELKEKGLYLNSLFRPSATTTG